MDSDYRKDLEAIVQAGQQEYRQVTIDMRVHQHNVLRNYAWLSTVLFGAQSWVLRASLDPSNPLLPVEGIALRALVVAVLVSAGCFCLSLYAMRGLGEAYLPRTISFTEMRSFAAQARDKEEPEAVLSRMIGDLEYATDRNRERTHWTGKRLRLVPWGLLLSVVLSAVAVARLGLRM